MTRTLTAIVDDATAIRETFGVLMPRLAIRGAYANTEDLLAERPDAQLVILDLHLTNSTQLTASHGIVAIPSIIHAGYPRVCIYTQEERPLVLAAGIAAGALGVVSKSAAAAVAEEAFLGVARGIPAVPQSIISLGHILARRGRLSILTDRQRDLLAHRARGRTYAEIGRLMHLSQSTLRGYWQDTIAAVSHHLTETSPGDLERALGLGPGDLLATDR